MASDLDALGDDFTRWIETFAALRYRRRFAKEAWFALGAIHGTVEALETLGQEDRVAALLTRAKKERTPDEVALLLDALARWLGR